MVHLRLYAQANQAKVRCQIRKLNNVSSMFYQNYIKVFYNVFNTT